MIKIKLHRLAPAQEAPLPSTPANKQTSDEEKTGSSNATGTDPFFKENGAKPPSGQEEKPDQRKEEEEPEGKGKKKPRKGHGRRSSDSWKNAETIFHQHETLRPGCPCPKCKTGKLYPYLKPARLIRFVASVPI